MNTSYLVSYSRSGSNWLHNLIAHAVFEQHGVAALAMDDDMIKCLIPSVSKRIQTPQNSTLTNYLNSRVIFESHSVHNLFLGAH